MPIRTLSGVRRGVGMYIWSCPRMGSVSPSLDDSRLTDQQRRACLLYLRYRRQKTVARKMHITQRTVSFHLHASVRKYPSLKAILLTPRGRRRARSIVDRVAFPEPSMN
jgi:DNA-binding CsgD family transcriptional regulator